MDAGKGKVEDIFAALANKGFEVLKRKSVAKAIHMKHRVEMGCSRAWRATDRQLVAGVLDEDG